MKLFLDENLSPEHAAELRLEGHDAVAVVDVGLSGASDEEVLRFAVENDRVLMTLAPILRTGCVFHPSKREVLYD